MQTQRQALFYASGPITVFSADAARHGAQCEGHALKQLSGAFGVPLYLARVANVWLGDAEVRVKPDAASVMDPREVNIIFEIKCPYSVAARKCIRDRIHLHARQCLLELLAFPLASCLVFAVFDYDPAAGALEHYDSAVHRLDRTSADEAVAELERLDLMQDLAGDVPNLVVAAILRRMVAKAVELPKVKDMTPTKVATLLPELFEHHAPEHVRVNPVDSVDPPLDSS